MEINVESTQKLFSSAAGCLKLGLQKDPDLEVDFCPVLSCNSWGFLAEHAMQFLQEQPTSVLHPVEPSPSTTQKHLEKTEWKSYFWGFFLPLAITNLTFPPVSIPDCEFFPLPVADPSLTHTHASDSPGRGSQAGVGRGHPTLLTPNLLVSPEIWLPLASLPAALHCAAPSDDTAEVMSWEVWYYSASLNLV